MWLSQPTWPNHKLIFGSAGFQMRDYPYFDPATRSVSFGAMMESLNQAAPGDAILLHGCCHNPSGADLTLDQWSEITDLLVTRGLLPFIDIAYQGLGDGMEEDAAGLRLLAERVPRDAGRDLLLQELRSLPGSSRRRPTARLLRKAG